jgi:hypothetical protein
MPLPIFSFLLFAPALAAGPQNYTAERDPPRPEPGKQYRQWLRTPGLACNAWRKVKVVLPKEDLLLSESKRDETGKDPGCKFLWVISSKAVPGDMKFELDRLTGRKEWFEVPAPLAEPGKGK